MNINRTAAEDDADATVLEQAAEILAERYGVLVAGDAIALLRNRAAAIRPAAGSTPAASRPSLRSTARQAGGGL